MSLPESLTRLVEQLQKLPGIGAKSAQRLAFHILRHPREDREVAQESRNQSLLAQLAAYL